VPRARGAEYFHTSVTSQTLRPVKAVSGCTSLSHMTTDRRLRLFAHIAPCSPCEDHQRVIVASVYKANCQLDTTIGKTQVNTTRDLSPRDHRRLRGLTSRDWTTRDQVSWVDIVRSDNAAPDQTEVHNSDNCWRIVQPTPSYASVGVNVLKSRH